MDRRKNPRDPSTSRSRVWVWKRRGGAALRKTESGKPKDRLRCTLGLFKTFWMIGCPEKQQSRSFDSSSVASFLRTRSGWHIHEDRDSRFGIQQSYNRFSVFLLTSLPLGASLG